MKWWRINENSLYMYVCVYVFTDSVVCTYIRMCVHVYIRTDVSTQLFEPEIIGDNR